MQQFACFYVKGSAPEPYRVIFTKTGDNLSTDCSCAAGAIGVACKHRIKILSNNPDGIIDLNMDDFNQVQKWLPGSDVDKAIQEIKKAEREYRTAKTNLSLAKKLLNKVLED